MRAKIVLFVSVLSVWGCAEPKYLNSNSGDKNGAGSKIECAARFKKSGLCLTWNWETKPATRAKGSLTFKVEADLPSLPEVILWMPSMGHGSTPTTVSAIDVGIYRVDEVFFVMPGEWEIRFQIKNGRAVADEAIVRIRF